jgi:hypothetical protein
MGFQKGHPRYGGRKKLQRKVPLADIKSAAQMHGPAIIEMLWAIVGEKTKSGRWAYETDSRLKAMQVLLDRGYGRPMQDISLTVKKHVDDYTDNELALVAGISLEDGSIAEIAMEDEGPKETDRVH